MLRKIYQPTSSPRPQSDLSPSRLEEERAAQGFLLFGQSISNLQPTYFSIFFPPQSPTSIVRPVTLACSIFSIVFWTCSTFLPGNDQSQPSHNYHLHRTTCFHRPRQAASTSSSRRRRWSRCQPRRRARARAGQPWSRLHMPAR